MSLKNQERGGIPGFPEGKREARISIYSHMQLTKGKNYPSVKMPEGTAKEKGRTHEEFRKTPVLSLDWELQEDWKKVRSDPSMPVFMRAGRHK